MLNYGVIGCGAVFEVFQARSLLQTEGLRVLTVCDIDANKVKKSNKTITLKREPPTIMTCWLIRRLML